MEKLSNDISHPVRDAFLELGHRAKTVAVGAYVALPILMASAPSVAYGHETGERHMHPHPDQLLAAAVAGVGLGLLAGKAILYATRNKPLPDRFAAYVGGLAVAVGSAVSLSYLRMHGSN